jgi:osmotically-inducible protein OsmY
MKNRMTAAIASLLVASISAIAFARGAQQVPPQQQTPEQMPPTASTSMTNNGQASQNGTMSSTSVEHEIKRALAQDGITATGVNVSFSDGTATLTGSVFSKQDIAKAKQVAMQVDGVTQVDVSGLHAQQG